MINHAYTLLLNRTAQYCADLNGCAYIPEEFRPSVLTPMLSVVKDAIIPVTSSKQSEVDAVNSVMRVLHSADLESYVLGLDKRVTYSLDAVDPVNLTSSVVGVTETSSGSDVVPKYKFANPVLLRPTAGVYTWRVDSVDAYKVKITNTKGMQDTVTLNPRSSASTSLSVEIIPGYLSIYFTLPTLYFTGTFRFNYTLSVTSSYDMAAAMTALKQAVYQGQGLFNYAPSAASTSVIPALKDIWLHHPALVTQFGAGVLAYLHTLNGTRS